MAVGYVVIVLTLAALANSQQQLYCSYFGNRAPSSQPSLTNCTWYNTSSCCLQEELNSLFPRVVPPANANKQCRNYINYLMCYVCAPNQVNFYANERLTVCESFCNDYFDACRDATLKGRTIGSTYANGRAFCLDRKFNVSTKAETCFTLDPAQRTLPLSSSGQVGISWAVLHLCTLIGFALPGNRWTAGMALVLGLWMITGKEAVVSQNVLSGMASTMEQAILSRSQTSLHRDDLQEMYDNVTVTSRNLNATAILQNIKNKLQAITSELGNAADQIQAAARTAYINTAPPAATDTLNSLGDDVYQDADFNPPEVKLSFTYNGTFRRKVNFDQSIIKISDTVSRTSSDVVRTVKWTADLDTAFKRLTSLRDVRWSYFGSEFGVYRIYPALEWSSNFAGYRDDYDPRTRPWYLSATSGPKNVAIFLDCSESMDSDGRWEIAKATVRQVLSTLTRDDFVNIICARGWFINSGGYRRNLKPKVLGCDKQNLIRATQSNRKLLIDAMNDYSPYGSGAEHMAALETILGMLPKTSDHCLNMLVFITDGKDTDPGAYRSVCYRHDEHSNTYRRFGCNKLVTDLSSIWTTAQSARRDARATRMVGIMVDDDGEELPGKLACDNQGVFIKLPNNYNLRAQMNPYYSYLAQSAMDNGGVTKPTSPYVDLQGLGRVITLSRPVFNPNDGTQLLGVLGVDAVLDDMEAALLDEQFGLSYAFLIDTEGKAIIHPRLKPGAELVDDPVYPSITELELHNKQPDAFYKTGASTEILSRMMRRETGVSNPIIGPRARQKGSRADGVDWISDVQFTYHFTSVDNTDYAFAFVLTEDDKVQYDVAEVMYMDGQGYNYYHEISRYTGDRVTELDRVTGATGYEKLTIARKQSTVKLAPRAYCNPTRYTLSGVPDFDFMDDFLNSANGSQLLCTAGGTVLPNIRSTVWLTQPIQNIWIAQGAIQQMSAWTYYGSQNGVWRVFPGARWPRPFDPTRRPWYHRSVANPPTEISLDSVYLDGGGVGKVVTLAQTVFEGKPTPPVSCPAASKPGGCVCSASSECKSKYCYRGSCANPQVAGVVATDILYTHFKDITVSALNAYTPRPAEQFCGLQYNCPGTTVKNCSTECVLLNDVAQVVYMRGLNNIPDGDTRSYQQLSFGMVYGSIMRDLLSKNVFSKITFVNRQGTCQVSPYSPRVSDSGIYRTAEEEDNFYENRGPIPRFQNDFGCEKDQIQFQYNRSTVGSDGYITGSVDGACGQEVYSFQKVNNTNLFVVVIERDLRNVDSFYNFNCHIANRAFTAGGFRLQEQACSRELSSSSGVSRTCKAVRDPGFPCSYNAASGILISMWLAVATLIVSAMLVA